MRKVWIPCVLLCAPLLTGCIAAVAAGAVAVAGYVQYERNEVSADIEADFGRVWNAVRRGLEEIGYPEGYEVTDDKSNTARELEVGKMWVRVEQHPYDTVRVRVRVGMFKTAEHRRRSKLFLERCQRLLGIEPEPEAEEAEGEGSAYIQSAPKTLPATQIVPPATSSQSE